MYSYSTTRIIAPLFLLIILWLLTNTYFIFIDDTFHTVNIHANSSCSPTFRPHAILLAAAFDICLSSVLLLLFIRPLMKLNQEMTLSEFKTEISTHRLPIPSPIAPCPTPTNPSTPITPQPVCANSSNGKIHMLKVSSLSIDPMNNVCVTLPPLNLKLSSSSSTHLSASPSTITNSGSSSLSVTPQSTLSMEMEPELDEMWQDIHNCDHEEDGKRASTSTSNPSVTAIDIETAPHEANHETCTKLRDAAKEAKQRRADLLRALEKQSSFRARAKNSADGGYEELKLRDAAKEAKQRRADLLRALERQSSFRARAKNSADGGYEELIVRYSLLVMICMTSSFALYLCVYVLYDWMVDFSPIDDVVNVW
eukprot:CAMPEP_0197073534 /NCGR_PEP_ID=MMETSP1384-20130603/210654_1 /TAXON_ID=29189 /ORGANISM="Ammonia sp." /LENGTH=366 /DNA_ID=CAMNT_0042512371 /DNA_START=229 /DNA_END=1326 /DNA_ORIENTATION=+